MAEADMAKRSVFGEVIKSLTKPEIINFADAEINTDQLRNSPFFASFNNDEYSALLKHSSLLKASKQCTLIHEGEKNTSYYIILFGAVQSNIVHNNKIAKISVHGPTALICSVSAIDKNLPSIINYTTCERAILLKITESDIESIQNDCIQLWYKLFDLTCESFATLERSTEKLDIRLNSELYNR
jgi:CRP-like cAMP-binding protein